MLNRIIWVILLFNANAFSQLVDLNQCVVKINENFAPKILVITDSILLRHAHNENTLYLQKGNDIKIFSFQNYGVNKAAIDKEERYLAIANYNKKTEIYKISNKEKIKTIQVKNLIPYAVQFYEQRLFLGFSDGRVLAESILGSEKFFFKAHSDVIRDICLYEDKLLTVSHDGFLKVWDINNGFKNIYELNLEKVLTKITISIDKKSIAIGCFDGSVVILDENFNKKVDFRPNTSIITQLKFKDNQTLISSSFDKMIISTDVTSLVSTILFKSKDYILTFDMYKNRFVYSDRKGDIFYYNLDCVIKK